MALSEAELERYARQIVLREIGGPGQARLRKATVALVGVGGLGAPAALYLAAAGVGRLRLIDDDLVAISNLQRQILFTTEDVGRPKTQTGAAALRALNPHIAIEAVDERLTTSNAAALLEGVDLILDGSDNFATRRIVNAAAIRAGAPLLSGAIGRWDGQVSLFHPAEGAPCYACLFPKDPDGAAAAPCEEAGVVGALAGVVGAMMGLEAIKRLTGAGETLLGRLWLYDALEASVRVISIRRDPDCDICRLVDRRR